MTYQYPPPPPPSNVPPVQSAFQRFRWVIIGAAVVFLIIFAVVLTLVVKGFNRVNTEMDNFNDPGQTVFTEQFDDQGAGIGPGGPVTLHLVASS